MFMMCLRRITLLVITATAGLLLQATWMADDLSPCRAIHDDDNPRFTALWVSDEGIWVADDLNHSLILYDRLSGEVQKVIRGLSTELDFPAAVQFDPTIELPDGRSGGLWASMNDTSDRAVLFSKDDGHPYDPSKMDVAPVLGFDFRTLTIDGIRIYNNTRVYGWYVDAHNDEIALGLEKGDWIASDGHSSLGSVVIVNRGGKDPSQLGIGKRWIRGPHTGIANPHGVWIDARHDEIYVANYGHLPQRPPQPPSVTIYDRLADGDAVPKRTIRGNRTHLGMPIKVFVDEQELIVADDQEGILVFDRLANGNVMPKRMIHSHNMPNGVFVDEEYDELVVANWFNRTIEFYARTWNPDDHHPLPKRTIAINPQVPVIGIGNPGALAYARDEIIAPNCVSHPGFTTYERTANGAVHPKRHVEGNKTQMSRSIHGLAIWPHPTDPSQDEVFIPKPLGSGILVFGRTDDGSVEPKRVIQGPATRLDDADALAVDDNEIGVPNRDHTILIFPRTGDGNIAPIRRITYRAGERDKATGKWLGPWGEGSRIQLGPAIWFDDKGTVSTDDDEIVVRARYLVPDPNTGGEISQSTIVFFPKNADGPTIPTRIIASEDLTGIHQVTVFDGEVFCAVQGVRAIHPPSLGGLAVFDSTLTSQLEPDGKALSNVSAKRRLRASDIFGGLSGVRHPRAVAVDPVRREVYLGDSKGNSIRVFPVDWRTEACSPK